MGCIGHSGLVVFMIATKVKPIEAEALSEDGQEEGCSIQLVNTGGIRGHGK